MVRRIEKSIWSGIVISNPMAKHQAVHARHPMNQMHFDRWVELFNKTIDSRYNGENADLLKERAKNIATIMVTKILGT